MRRFQAGTGFNPSPLRLVYTRCFSSRTTLKSGDHGALACRPRKMSYGSGTTPSRADAAPSGPAQKRDNKTHRPVKLPSGGLLDRGPPSSYVTKAGQVRSLRGSGWPPTNGIAWIRARKRRAFPCKPGGRSGGRVLSRKFQWLLCNVSNRVVGSGLASLRLHQTCSKGVVTLLSATALL